jgi:hypothetical protein
MLIRLNPHGSQPAHVFTLSFGPLRDDLPIPNAWAYELQRLAADGIQQPSPSGLLALDKSVGLMNVLQEVTLDVPGLTVTCLFIDGHRHDWMMDAACVAFLENILADIDEMYLESERERRSLESKERVASESSDSRPTKHKKQRSLLMSLVA